MAGRPESSLAVEADVAEPITPAGSSGGPSRRVKGDVAKFMAKLVDQSFQMKNYPDPLMPRSAEARLLPKNVTPEMERDWLDRISAARSDVQP
ncbi:hypothetical protein HIM_04000 [Hirsutella minnesotensis 3608]|uniref:Uncharacterized protein n=1 Tax=Hirsutella minnesotensis 3608 TaxID=1043627 RepID=A0A0F8A690_9HYPO|nr:hypothetical protein HIM_04000 [Hirsutella minnesotensis 3608]